MWITHGQPRATGPHTRRRSRSSGSIYRVLPVCGWFPIPKPLPQKLGSTFLPLQDIDPTPSFGGFGLRRQSLGLFSLRRLWCSSLVRCRRMTGNVLSLGVAASEGLPVSLCA